MAEAPVSLQNHFLKKKKKKKTFPLPVLLSAKLIYCYPLSFPKDQTGSLRQPCKPASSIRSPTELSYRVMPLVTSTQRQHQH